jgi:uncharacterized protein YkwD
MEGEVREKSTILKMGFRGSRLAILATGLLLLTSKPAQATEVDAALLSQDQQQVTIIVNQQRASYQENSVQMDPTLNAVAQAYAYDMFTRSYFDHVSPEGTTMGARLRAGNAPYGWAGENISSGRKDPMDVMTGWMNSAGHRKNILNTHFTKMGVGHYGNIWVEEFTDNGR